VSVGIVPLEFEAGDGPDEFGLTGDELIQVEGLSTLREPLGHAIVTSTAADGRTRHGACACERTRARNCRIYKPVGPCES
jgi:aconitase A